MKRASRISIVHIGGIAISGFLAIVLPSAAQASDCSWDIEGEWTFVQSNDTNAVFTLKRAADGLRGSAYFQGSEGIVNGQVNGVQDGNSVRVTAYWDNGVVGDYWGTIDPQGRISGSASSRSSSDKATWYTDQTLECVPHNPDALKNFEKNLIDAFETPNTVKAQGRVKAGGTGASGTPLEICEAARRARERNSPAAPGLTASCLAAGGGEATQEISE